MNTPVPRKLGMTRRNLIKGAAASGAAGAAGMVPGLNTAVYAQGSDKPEKEEVRIGFIPPTEAQSVSGMKPIRTSSFSGLSEPWA